MNRPNSVMGTPNMAEERAKQEALAKLDLVAVARAYIQGVVDAGGQGYRALLLDKETMRVCSTLFGRTELAEHNVVHIERIDEHDPARRQHRELKAMCLLRPTRDNVTALKNELDKARYKSYHVYFTNLLAPMHLRDIAEADCVREMVEEVQEFYADFCVVDECNFHIPCANNSLLISPKASTAGMEIELIDRFVQGLSALFLALRRRPVIRYQRGSDPVRRLADGLYQLTYKQQYQVFDFGARSNPIVLLLDRRDDPVTPLLTQWTYQAMIHELIGIEDNICNLTSVKVPDDQRAIVLDPRQDDFFRRHVLANYGEVGSDVKRLVEQFQQTSEKHKNVETLEDMRRFVMEHMDFQKLQGNVGKHVNIMSDLSEAVASRNLMEVSMAEQELATPATNLSAAASYDEVARLLRHPDVHDRDKVRLVMLFALRFESDASRVRMLQELLLQAGVRDRSPRLFEGVDQMLRYGGAQRRAGDLYASRSIMNKAKAVFKGLQGVDNVYTQHTPLLTATLTQLSTDKLDVAAYPYQASSADEAMAFQAAFKRTPPREVIVFIVGGTTYEEARNVAEWNERNPHMRVVLGGSCMLNSETFLRELTGHEFPKKVAPPSAAAAAAPASNGAHAIDIR